MPTYGAILLSANLMNVLLVQSFCSLDLWGFPKGKIEDNEEPHRCAIREVLEETSYDISPFINRNWYVEGDWKNATSTGFTGLYIIPNVPMDTQFSSRTEGEIKFFKWFRLSDLFVARNGLNVETSVKITANTFYMKNRLQRFLIENKLEIFNKWISTFQFDCFIDNVDLNVKLAFYVLKNLVVNYKRMSDEDDKRIARFSCFWLIEKSCCFVLNWSTVRAYHQT